MTDAPTPRPEIATPLRLMLRASARGGYGLADMAGRVVCSTPPKADNAQSLADLTAVRDLANAAARLAELTAEQVALWAWPPGSIAGTMAAPPDYRNLLWEPGRAFHNDLAASALAAIRALVAQEGNDGR